MIFGTTDDTAEWATRCIEGFESNNDTKIRFEDIQRGPARHVFTSLLNFPMIAQPMDVLQKTLLWTIDHSPYTYSFVEGRVQKTGHLLKQFLVGKHKSIPNELTEAVVGAFYAFTDMVDNLGDCAIQTCDGSTFCMEWGKDAIKRMLFQQLDAA